MYLSDLHRSLYTKDGLILIIDNWEKVFNFDSAIHHDDRDKILFQTLTLYIVNLFNMPSTKVTTLKKQLPDTERSWVDQIPEIFGEKYKQEGREEGRQEASLALNKSFTIKTIQKFPKLTDAEVADLVGVTVEYVQQIRRGLEEKG
jgi:hypothetical protein